MWGIKVGKSKDLLQDSIESGWVGIPFQREAWNDGEADMACLVTSRGICG
jgi:hypothetical protein